jgi:hypothetical protein
MLGWVRVRGCRLELVVLRLDGGMIFWGREQFM